LGSYLVPGNLDVKNVIAPTRIPAF